MKIAVDPSFMTALQVIAALTTSPIMLGRLDCTGALVANWSCIPAWAAEEQIRTSRRSIVRPSLMTPFRWLLGSRVGRRDRGGGPRDLSHTLAPIGTPVSPSGVGDSGNGPASSRAMAVASVFQRAAPGVHAASAAPLAGLPWGQEEPGRGSSDVPILPSSESKPLAGRPLSRTVPGLRNEKEKPLSGRIYASLQHDGLLPITEIRIQGERQVELPTMSLFDRRPSNKSFVSHFDSTLSSHPFVNFLGVS